MVASPVKEEQQVVEAAGQVVPLGTVVKNTGPDDHGRIIELLVPMSDKAPQVRSLRTHSGRSIQLYRVCHFQPSTGKIRFIENRVREGQTLAITEIAELHLK